MKVDYHGTVRPLQKFMMGPAVENKQRQSEGTPFTRVLGDLHPKSLENNNKVQKEAVSHRQTVEAKPFTEGPMAHYSFQTPEFLTEELSPRTLEMPKIAENDASGVKSPTLLSVKRLSKSEESAVDVYASKKERVAQVENLVKEAGAQHGIDPSLGMAVVSIESAFNPRALSTDGHFSKGLFQLLDSTAETIIKRDGLEDSYSPYEATQNVDLGVRYLRYLHDLFTKETTLSNGMKVHPTANSTDLEKLAVAAFNAGEGRVAASQSAAIKAGEDPSVFANVLRYLPESTQEYVSKVMQEKKQFIAMPPKL